MKLKTPITIRLLLITALMAAQGIFASHADDHFTEVAENHCVVCHIADSADTPDAVCITDIPFGHAPAIRATGHDSPARKPVSPKQTRAPPYLSFT